MTEPRRSVKAGRLEHLVWCMRRSPEHAGGGPADLNHLPRRALGWNGSHACIDDARLTIII